VAGQKSHMANPKKLATYCVTQGQEKEEKLQKVMESYKKKWNVYLQIMQFKLDLYKTSLN